jgi:hypothetical protein
MLPGIDMHWAMHLGGLGFGATSAMQAPCPASVVAGRWIGWDAASGAEGFGQQKAAGICALRPAGFEN